MRNVLVGWAALCVLVSVGCQEEIVFQSDADGDNEIYTMYTDGSGLRKLTDNAFDDINPALSANGSLLVYASNAAGNFDICISSPVPKARIRRLTTDPANDTNPSFNPNGRQIAFETERHGSGPEPQTEIYVMRTDGSYKTRLTFDPAFDNRPVFSPDDSKIAFTSNRDEDFHVYIMDADGTDVHQLTFGHDSWCDACCFTPDGSRIVYSRFAALPAGVSMDLFTMRLDGSDPQQLTFTPEAYESRAACNPAGDLIAYTRVEIDLDTMTTTQDVWLMNADGSGQRNLTNQPTVQDDYPCFAGSR